MSVFQRIDIPSFWYGNVSHGQTIRFFFFATNSQVMTSVRNDLAAPNDKEVKWVLKKNEKIENQRRVKANMSAGMKASMRLKGILA